MPFGVLVQVQSRAPLKLTDSVIFSCYKKPESSSLRFVGLESWWFNIRVHFAYHINRLPEEFVLIVWRILVCKPDVDRCFCAIIDEFLDIFIIANYLVVLQTPF